jgi:SAM-dependent methyltransferase
VVAACGARSGPIVEIGCGQGGFLRRLGTRLGEGAVLVGVDAVCRAVADARTDIRYFASLLGELDERDVPRAAAVVYARHVIEHVPDPVGFLAEWASTGIAPAGTPILLETPRLEWILETGTLVDFVYEHCNYFSARSLARIVARAGFALQSIAPFFNGQYALVEARKADGPVAGSVAHSHIAADVMRFASAERRLGAAWHARIRAAAEAGPVAVWGAGAKGVTLVNLFDPDAALVDCLIDVNPAKQGRFVPGTGHAIVTPEAASGRGIVAAFVMNDNYLVEMRAQIDAFAQPFALLSFDDGA